MAAIGVKFFRPPKYFLHFNNSFLRESSVSVPVTYFNTERQYATGSTSDLTKYKRGRGGRSSFSGLVCTVFGCSGYVGPYLTNHLAKIGSQVITMYRGDPMMVRQSKVHGDLGQIIQLPFDIDDEESVRRAIKYSNVVINLVGREHESMNYTFEDVHVNWPRRLAKLCREMNVSTLLHISALNCSPYPQPYFIKDGSKWLKSKYHGEVAVKEEFPDAIIFRPSDIFGWHDRFFFYYASRWRHLLPLTAITELWGRGENTEKQPVFIGDVCRGITAAVSNPNIARGKTFEIVGPYRYNQGEMVDFFMACMRRDTDEYDMTFMTRYRRIHPTKMMNLKCFISDKFRIFPWVIFRRVHWEKIERECFTDFVNPVAPGLGELGVTNLVNMEDRAIYDLRIIRVGPNYGAPEDSGIIDPLEMEGKHPRRITPNHIEAV